MFCGRSEPSLMCGNRPCGGSEPSLLCRNRPCGGSEHGLWRVGTLSAVSEPLLWQVGTRFVEGRNLTPFGLYNIKRKEVWGRPRHQAIMIHLPHQHIIALYCG